MKSGQPLLVHRPKKREKRKRKSTGLKGKVIPKLVHKVEKEKVEFDKVLKTAEKCAIIKV